jgi:hypothetical protein
LGKLLRCYGNYYYIHVTYLLHILQLGCSSEGSRYSFRRQLGQRLLPSLLPPLLPPPPLLLLLLPRMATAGPS